MDLKSVSPAAGHGEARQGSEKHPANTAPAPTTQDIAASNSLADLRIVDSSKYQLMPDMSPAEFEALKADIAERGVVVPIDIDDAGEILDGHHRYRAWAELKKPDGACMGRIAAGDAVSDRHPRTLC
jgi:hypothetical protein